MRAPSEALGCMRCQLWCSRDNVVWGEGPVYAPIMLVGDAPAHRENIASRPFVGGTGASLTRMLGKAGIQREETYLALRVMCQPPGREPLPLEREACQHWFSMQLEAVQPQLVVLLGRAAADYAFPGEPLHEVRQTVRAMQHGEQVNIFIATYHPSALYRNPDLEPIIVEDLIWGKGLVA